MTELAYVPAETFKKVLSLAIPAEEKADLFSTLCRINVVYMIKRAGSGHIGTSFSSLDIMTWLFLNELRLPSDAHAGDGDVFFSSKGHDVPAKYAVLLALGLLPFEKIHQLRRLGGLPGHPDVSVPWMHTNTGSLGMGISKARGMALARRLKQQRSQFFVLTGDGELQEGQFWESLQPTVNRELDEITVIVDHNKIQSDTWVSKVSDLGDLEQKLAAFGWHVARCDGHDFAALNRAFTDFKQIRGKPKVLIADTVKGKGVSFMEHTAMKPGEDRLYRFHSGAPADDIYLRAQDELVARANSRLTAVGQPPLVLSTVPHSAPQPVGALQRLIPAYSAALIEQAERRLDLVALDADLALDTGLIPFEERFPGRFFECGIAEQDMVSQAGGMALEGLLPVVHSFACFLSDRPNEQIYNNATERTKVLYVGSLAGLLPGGPGHSHQCVRDISALAGVPGLTLIEPSCEHEVRLAVDYCVNRTAQSSYLRLVSIPCDIPYRLPDTYELELGKGVAITEGDDAIVFAYGPVMLSQAYYAAQQLSTHAIGIKVINLPWLNHVDSGWLRSILANYSLVFTLDNHYLAGGQGAFLSSRIGQLGLSKAPRIHMLGVEGIPMCGTNDEVLQAHKLDMQSIAGEIMRTLQLGIVADMVE